MHEFENKLADWTIARRWWLISLTLIVTMVAAYGLLFIKIDSDLRVFFSSDDPRLLELEALEDTYTKTESIIFIVSSKQGDVFTRETLTAIKALTQQSWQIPFSSRVDSITNYQHSYAIDDELLVGDFIDQPELLTAEQLEEKHTQALANPLLVSRLISQDAKTVGVMTNIVFDTKTPDDVTTVAEYSRQLRDDFRARYPALISVLPVKAKNAPIIASQRFFNALADFVIKYKNTIVWSLGSLVLVGGISATNNSLNDDWIKYFSDNIPMRVATDMMENRLSGSDYIDYSLPAGEPGGINEPVYLENLERFTR